MEKIVNSQLSTANDQTLARLETILGFAEGHTLLFACCNAPTLREQIIAILNERLTGQSIAIYRLTLNEPTRDLRTQVKAILPTTLNEDELAVLMITGLEYSIPYETPEAPMLAELNLGRELLQMAAPLPVLFWLPDYAITALTRYALDFWSWRSSLFEFETDQQHHVRNYRQYVEADQKWRAMNNLTLEQKLRRRRILEGLLADYEAPVEVDDGTEIIQTTQQERLLLHRQLGRVHSALQEYSQAQQYYEAALEMAEKLGEITTKASVLNSMGLVYDSQQKKDEALRCYNLALVLFRQVKENGGEAATLTNMGRVYSSLGKKEEALLHYNQALPLFQQLEDKGSEAVTLTNIGDIYDSSGDKEGALRYYNRSLNHSQQVGDKAIEANILNNLGTTYDSLGKKEEALHYFNLALPLIQQVGRKRNEATTLFNLGHVYGDLGEKKEALHHYNLALPLYQQMGDKEGEAVTLNNIGVIYYSLGGKEEVLRYYNLALSLYQQVGDVWHESILRYNMALTHRELGELTQAVAHLEQAVAIDKKVDHPNLKRSQAMLEEIRAILADQANA